MRIIAGAFGGRRLVAPRGLATRPTGDRAKEALFSWLGPIDGGRVLDLYAGTGALGLEALSRGADAAVLVESASAALEALRANVRTLGCDARTTVLGSRVERVLARLATLGPFDWIFADPPWAIASEAASALAELARLGAMTSVTTVVLEHDAGDRFEVDGLELVDRRTYGDTGLSRFVLGASVLDPADSAPTAEPASTS